MILQASDLIEAVSAVAARLEHGGNARSSEEYVG
jgi:hypothetical protein